MTLPSQTEQHSQPPAKWMPFGLRQICASALSLTLRICICYSTRLASSIHHKSTAKHFMEDEFRGSLSNRRRRKVALATANRQSWRSHFRTDREAKRPAAFISDTADPRVPSLRGGWTNNPSVRPPSPPRRHVFLLHSRQGARLPACPVCSTTGRVTLH